MDFSTKVKAFLTLMKESAKAQTILFSTIGVLGIGGLGIGGFSLYEHYYGPEAVASAEVNTENSQSEKEELAAASTEVTEETETAETETETETETGPVLVKLNGSSIEKDLKIKIQNEEKRNVKGEEFCIIVTPDKKNAKSSVYNDDDNDGIIYITDIAGGDYLVALEEIEGYYTEEESIKVTVKEQIEYVKVEVKDEIKSEAEVSPEEDAQGKTEDVDSDGSGIKDTQPSLDSKVTSTEVAASQIDASVYQAGKASVMEQGDPVTVSATGTIRNLAFSYRNLFFVRTGMNEGGETDTTDTQETEKKDGTEIPGSTEKPVDTEKPGDTTTPSEPETGTPSEPDNKNQTATIKMPKKAQLYISTRGEANTLELSVEIEDANGIIDKDNIEWSISEDKTAGLTVDGAAKGQKVKISSANSQNEGTAKVTATIPTKQGNSTQLECVIQVNRDIVDTSIALEDSAGDLLYLDKDCTKPATVGDLTAGNVTTFYKNPKYTGWQVLDGKMYYFGADNKPVTGQQVIGGVQYSFGTDGALGKNTAVGIDVSKYQTSIDWNAVKAAGVEFVIIRVGYRGSSTGVLVEDPYFKSHIQGATKAGLKVGVYFFTQAITKAEAVEEASMALALTEGYNLAYPIFIDTERIKGNGRANNLDKATRTEIVDAFCQTIQNAGKKAGVYASTSWYNTELNASKLEKYYIWVAQYNTECSYTGRYDIWQYSEDGQIPGIKGNVDLNISYMH